MQFTIRSFKIIKQACKNLPRILILTFLLMACSEGDKAKSILNAEDVRNTVFVGGTLISSMEEHPYLELAMTKYFHGADFSFKNIGWAADDVYGMARSQFGSAQNTKSWNPPSAEEGFGSEVLRNHIDEASPSTLFIAYGSEAAFFTKEEDFDLFESGYLRLLDFAEKKNTNVILLTAPRHEAGFSKQSDLEKRNASLARINKFISLQAESRGIMVIDLYNKVLASAENTPQTLNGIQLNARGYARMSEVILEALQIVVEDDFKIEIDENGQIVKASNCETSQWEKTVNGVQFTLKPSRGIVYGEVSSPQFVSIYVNGRLESRSGTINNIELRLDSERQERLVNTIKEKNRLYRNRLRPLNEAYIYLFRQHEMGHLAYEMDDLLKLVGEKEKEISRLIDSYSYDFEIELEKPYQAPKKYADDEIPAFIPEPDISAELLAFKIAEGYEISLFASDPMIANPININWDARGRAWVATSSTYPHIVPGREPNDKIVILEDTNGDGKVDKHIVFAENLLVPHSVMPVKGGAYVTSTTQLLFLADQDGDDKAEDRQVVFDGFGNADVHHTIHGLRWTPWGDLHFTQGIYINSFIETTKGIKKLNGSGIWSFRPEKNELDIYSRGLVNPWGEAIDRWGQTFATDGAGSSGINYVFPESAHRSAVGASSILDGLNEETPKYTAADFVYSSHFPSTWQGDIITNDFRANRTVRYKLEAEGSSYKSEEQETLLFSEHRSYRPVDAKIGPDGALYIVDWYNPIIDHGEVDFHHPKRDKSHGRIWKLKKKGSDLLTFPNMESLSNLELLNRLKSTEQLSRLLANRTLVERKIAPQEVKKWLSSQKSNRAEFSTYRIETLWLLASLGHYDAILLNEGLRSRKHKERAASTRLIAHYDKENEMMPLLEELIQDEHPQVRLEALHVLREVASLEAAEVAMKAYDLKRDKNINFVLSLLLENSDSEWLQEFEKGSSIFEASAEKQMFALLNSNDRRTLPHIHELIRGGRVSKDLTKRAWEHLAKIGDGETKFKVLERAIAEHDINLVMILNSAPKKYSEVPNDLSILDRLIMQDSTEMQMEGIKLAGRWKASSFADKLVDLAESSDKRSVLLEINRALAKMEKLERVIEMALNGSSPAIKVGACAVWVENDLEEASSQAISLLKTVEDAELGEILFYSFRRTDHGPELLTSLLENVEISETMASAGLKVVQTSGINLVDLEVAIRKAGSISSVGMEMTDEEKDALLTASIESGNLERGRIIYRRNELMCGSCHVVNKEGGLSGPYLGKIGTFMTPRAILESVINPNAVIKQNYETLVITMKDGEVVSGIQQRKKGSSTLIRQANGKVIEIADDEIEKTDVSSYSLMPSGLTRNLHKDELKDLLSYLMSLGVEN